MFQTRINGLRKQNKETQQQMGERLNVSQRSVASWESGDRMPSYEVLVDIANKYKVSTDYLLGITDIPNLYVRKFEETDGSSVDCSVGVAPNSNDSLPTPITVAAHTDAEITPAMEVRIAEIVEEIVRKYGVKGNN